MGVARPPQNPLPTVQVPFVHCVGSSGMSMSVPLVTVIGKSRSGKTTLLEKLIGELTRRGYRVGTIKHHSHRGFEIDQEGKDSWRHARAGSTHVVIASPDRIASYRSLDHELSLDEIMREMTDVDIVLAEGYMQAGRPTIQVVRASHSLEVIGSPSQCIAFATDARLDVPAPCFGLDDVVGLTDLVQRTFLPTAASRRGPTEP
jgi:molybdopterin-guanine dinucleotide biosynthesis protein B